MCNDIVNIVNAHIANPPPPSMQNSRHIFIENKQTNIAFLYLGLHQFIYQFILTFMKTSIILQKRCYETDTRDLACVFWVEIESES